MKSDDLVARCARGGGALAASTLVERGARFARNMILARWLAPDQFGLMAIVLAAGQLFEALTEVGTRPAIVQNRRGDSAAFLNAAWWVSAVRGVLILLLGVVAAPWFADFYDEPQLTALLRVAFLSTLFNGLASPRLMVLQKHLQFGRYAWITQGAGAGGTVLTLVLALFVRDVWALVIGSVAEALLAFVISFLLCPIRIRLPVDRDCMRDLLVFTRGMVGLSMLTFIVMQADVFVLGKLVSPAELGMYSLAVALANMPLMVFTRVFQPLLLPVLSEAQADLPLLRRRVLAITRLLFTFGLPLTATLVVCGQPLLLVTYGPAYVAMSAAFGMLCVYQFLYLVGVIIASTYLAVGRPALHRRFTIVRGIVVAVVIYPAALEFGPVGAAGALLAGAAVANWFQIRQLQTLLVIRLRDYGATATIGLLCSAIVVIPALPDWLTSLEPISHLVAFTILCGLAWLVGAWLVRPGTATAHPVPAASPS